MVASLQAAGVDALDALAWYVPAALLALAALFYVAVLSNDAVYLVLRLFSPADKVWVDATRHVWVAVWFAVWAVQVPFWVALLPSQSVLLTAEQTKLALVLHHALLLKLRDVGAVVGVPS